MIPRSLVPRDARPPAENPDAPPRRLTTLLDDRTIVTANLPHIILDTRTAIPAHMPLDVLASRQVIPRDMPATPLDPARVQIQGKARVTLDQLPEGLEPDVLTTGDVNLMVEPVEAPKRDWNWIARTGSIAAHGLFIIFILLQSKLFPYRGPTQQQIDMARQQLSFIYMPPDVRGTPAPRVGPSPAIRVDPRVLRKIAPGEIQPLPGPKVPEHVVRNETPVEAPPEMPPPQVPQTQASRKPPDFLRGTVEEPKPQPSPSPSPNSGLILPRSSSPGRSLEESAEGALHGGGAAKQFGGQIPGRGGPGGRGCE